MSAIQPAPGCTPVTMSVNLDVRNRTVSIEREQAANAQQARPQEPATTAEVPVAKTDDTSERRTESLNTRLSFGYDEESGRVYVQIVRSDTGEVVRQRPPESMLEMLAQIREMIGLILDEKA